MNLASYMFGALWRTRFLVFVLAFGVVLVLLTTGDVGADIDSFSGDVQNGALASVQAGESEHNSLARVFREKNSYTLTGPEAVNVFLPAGIDAAPCNVWKIPNPSLERNGLTNPGVIPAGWNVDSHIIHADRVSDSESEPWNYYDGRVTFVDRIIGVIFNEADLDDSDDQFGRDGTQYPIHSNVTHRDFENNDAGANGNIDSVTINCGGTRRVNFHLEVADAMDQLRVVTLNYADFVISKNFSPNSSSPVSVSVSCGGATVTPSSALVTESNPAEFQVRDFDFSPTPNCVATENEPAGAALPNFLDGYSTSRTCSDNLLDGGCTITNTLRTGTVTLDKDFSDSSTATVYADLSCTPASPDTGIQTITPSGRQTVTHSTNRTWTVTGFGPSTVCTVTEFPNATDPAGPPPGYTAAGTPPGPSGHQCTAPALTHLGAVTCKIMNIPYETIYTVTKDWLPDNPTGAVSITLACPPGVTVLPSAAQSFVGDMSLSWTVRGFSPGGVCTAEESPNPPSGYAATGLPPAAGPPSGKCQAAGLAHGVPATCTIRNTENSTTYTVTKDWVPNNSSGVVSITLTCPPGVTVLPSPSQSFTGDMSLSWTVKRFITGASCTAEELPNPPDGYTATGLPVAPGAPSGKCRAAGLAHGITATCTITNTLKTGTVRLNKNFSPVVGTTVYATLSCPGTGATVTPSARQPVTHTVDATWTVTGWTGATASCTATEYPGPTGSAGPPPGYFASGSPEGTCEAPTLSHLAIVSCTITNSLDPQETFRVYKATSDGSLQSVTVMLECDLPQPDFETATSASGSTAAVPAVWVLNVSSFQLCRATELAAPNGYFSDGPTSSPSDDRTCTGTISPGTDGSCTIVNTLREAWVEVEKDFSDDNPADVDVTLTCTSGTVEDDPPSDHTASEADTALIRVYGFNPGATCGASESRPDDLLDRYADTYVDCTSIPLIHGQTNSDCEITNTPTSTTFKVIKHFLDVDGVDVPDPGVTVDLDCGPGVSISPPPPVVVTMASPVTFTVTGFLANGAACTATEDLSDPALDVYSPNQADCAGRPIQHGTPQECAIANTATIALVQVTKDFSDTNPAGVDVTVGCQQGTTTPPTQTVSEGSSPVDFYVEYFPLEGGTVCGVSEVGVPVGYIVTTQCQNGGGVGHGDTIQCTVTNRPTSATITVKKDFDDDNGASVNVTLTCDGAPIISPSATLPASETTDAVFTVTYFDADGVNCEATESGMPAGYTQDLAASNCDVIPIVDGPGATCTIVNRLNESTFTVTKNFEPDLPAGTIVQVTLECEGEDLSPAGAQPVGEQEGEAATWTVTGFDGDPSCTATESGPSVPGYVHGVTCSEDLSEGGCTIVNPIREDTFTVKKDFVPDDPAGTANISLECQFPQPTDVDGQDPSPVFGPAVTETTPFEWRVFGYEGDPLCTATESPVSGYSGSGSPAGTCQALLSVGECTITNTKIYTFTVRKDYVPNSPIPVMVSLSCVGATVAPPVSRGMTESAPAGFVLENIVGDPSCTAIESVPPGYSASGSPPGTCTAVLSVGECTITNTLIPPLGTFTVEKDFEPNNAAASTTVSLSCGSASVSPSSGSVSEANPRTFTVSGASGNPMCTATESPVPGYAGSGTPEGTCQALLSAGTCKITNTRAFTVYKDFVPNEGGDPSVTVTLNCVETGTIAPIGTVLPAGPVSVSEGVPRVFTVSNFTGDPLCIAREMPVPAGYTSNGMCQANIISVGLCTITNTNSCPADDPRRQYTPTNSDDSRIDLTFNPIPSDGPAHQFAQTVKISWIGQPVPPPPEPEGHVTGAGYTCVNFTAAPPAPEPPEGFELIGSGNYKLYFEIGTTATWIESARVCVKYQAGFVSEQDAPVYLYHYSHLVVDGQEVGWKMIGEHIGGGEEQTVCGDVSQPGGFSPFAVVQAVPVGGVVEVVDNGGSADESARLATFAAIGVVLSVLAVVALKWRRRLN